MKTNYNLINGFKTNLGKYNEGHLIGEWVSFPISGKELDEVLKRIGINEEYEEYCYMLINGISLYTKSGDTYSAEVCKKELIKVSQRLEQAEKRISKLNWDLTNGLRVSNFVF